MYKELLLFKLMIKYKNKIFLQNFKPILAENKNSMPLNIKKNLNLKQIHGFLHTNIKLIVLTKINIKKRSSQSITLNQEK